MESIDTTKTNQAQESIQETLLQAHQANKSRIESIITAMEQRFKGQTTAETFNKDTMLEYIKAYVRDVGLVNHQIGSFNELVAGNGLKNIMKNFFHIQRDVMVKDSQIYKSVHIDIQFTDVKFKNPYQIAAQGNKVVTTGRAPVYPAMVWKTDQSYEAEMYFDFAITLTPTMYHKGDRGESRTEHIKDVMMSSVPIMVKSSLCNLVGKNPMELLDIYGDDPIDKGGYFIVKGHEWVVSSEDSVLYNYLHIRKQQKQKSLIRGMILSREHESGFGNSYQTNFRLYNQKVNNYLLTIEVNQTSYNLLEIPFQIFYRMFGVSTDRQIAKYILWDEDDTSPLTQKIWNVLDQSFNACPEQFKKIEKSRDQNEILEFIARELTKKKTDEALPTLDDVDKLRAFTLDFFNKQFMTQFAPSGINLGRSESDIIECKLIYTGILIRQMIMCEIGITTETDRDAYKTKRVNTPGVQYAKEFKTVFSTYVVKPLVSQLINAINQPQFTPQTINISELLQAVLFPMKNEIGTLLRRSLSTNNDVVYSKKRAIKNRISSQEQHRKNAAFTIQSQRQIITDSGKIGSSNERAAELRHVHPSFLGYICPFQTVETGPKIGMNKQLAITAMITNSIDSFGLVAVLKTDSNIIPLLEIKLPDLLHKGYGPVYVNGTLIGCSVVDLFKLRENYVQHRRNGVLHEHTSICVDIQNKNLLFYTDSGRIIRPLIIVHKTKDGQKYTKMTPAVINALITRQIRFQDLVTAHIVEYISADEQENCWIAQNIDLFHQQKSDPLKNFTHIDIEQSIMGIMALLDPYANHSQPQRASFETNQAKQTCGWPFLNYGSRFNKTAYMQHAGAMPIVKTIGNDIMLPGGQNIFIAILISDGYNQEDSLIFNRASIDRCLMFLTHFTFKYVELEKNEQLGKPDADTKDVKPNLCYDKLGSNGIVREGVVVRKGDVLVAKKQKVNKGEEGVQHVDTSAAFDDNEPMMVEKVVYHGSGDETFVKIKLKQPKPIVEGDKFSSREGCKGVVGEIKEPCDMPYTRSGLIPDMILSAISIPTRMIIGELLEMCISRINAKKGIITDGTAFTYLDVMKILDELEKMGVPFSNETMYNGRTGEKMQYKVFCSTVFQQRLQKFASELMYVVADGPRNSTTRQPLEGKNRQGGLKIGEMENWCLQAHGSTGIQREKLHADSDGYMSYICENCGKPDIIVNQQKGKYMCPNCKQFVNVTAVPSCWSNNIFQKEVEAMGVGIRFKIKPLDFMVNQQQNSYTE